MGVFPIDEFGNGGTGHDFEGFANADEMESFNLKIAKGVTKVLSNYS